MDRKSFEDGPLRWESEALLGMSEEVARNVPSHVVLEPRASCDATRGYYQDLKCWQVAMELAVEVYRSTASFPKIEVYGLSAQLRRAVVSVSSNIAEGAGRNSKADFARFVGIAHGSVWEVETQLLIAERLGYLESAEQGVILTSRVARMLVRLRQYLEGAA